MGLNYCSVSQGCAFERSKPLGKFFFTFFSKLLNNFREEVMTREQQIKEWKSR
jgi:hypothetical protein